MGLCDRRMGSELPTLQRLSRFSTWLYRSKSGFQWIIGQNHNDIIGSYIYICVCVCWMLKYFICLFIPFHNHPIIIYWNEKHPIKTVLFVSSYGSRLLKKQRSAGSSKVHQAEGPNLGCPWRESAARPPAVAFPSSDPHPWHFKACGVTLSGILSGNYSDILSGICSGILSGFYLAFYLWRSISQFVPVLLRATKLAQSASQ